MKRSPDEGLLFVYPERDLSHDLIIVRICCLSSDSEFEFCSAFSGIICTVNHFHDQIGEAILIAAKYAPYYHA